MKTLDLAYMFRNTSTLSLDLNALIGLALGHCSGLDLYVIATKEINLDLQTLANSSGIRNSSDAFECRQPFSHFGVMGE